MQVSDDLSAGRAVFDMLAMGADPNDITEGKVTAQNLMGFDTSPDTVMRALEYQEQMETQDVQESSAVESEGEDKPDEPDAEDMSASNVSSESVAQDVGKKKNSAQDRIREVISQRNEAVDQLKTIGTAMESRLQQQQSLFEQQVGNLQQQNVMLTEQLSKLLQRAEAVDDANLDPVEIFKRDVVKSQQTAYQKQLQEALAPLQKKVIEYDERDANRKREETHRKRMEAFERETVTVRNDVVLKDLSSKDVANLGEIADEFVLNYASTFKQKPSEAGHEFKKFLDTYYKARMTADTTKSKEVRDKTRKAPTVIVGSRTPASGMGMPKYSKDQLNDAGYSNYFSAMVDNFRRVKPSQK